MARSALGKSAGRRLGAGLALVLAAMALVPELVLWPSPGGADVTPQACRLAERLRAPSLDHWAGTDGRGCDYLAQVVHGASTSLGIALGAVGMGLVVAVVLGVAAGYRRGLVDQVVARAGDVVLGVGFLVAAMVVLATVAGPGPRRPAQVSLALAAVAWPPLMRVIRAATIEVVSRDYIDAARATGAGPLRVMATHVMPNAVAPALAYAALGVAGAVGAEATLTFLGVGLGSGATSWGNQLAAAQPLAVGGRALHLLVAPSLALVATGTACVLLAEAGESRLGVRHFSRRRQAST